MKNWFTLLILFSFVPSVAMANGDFCALINNTKIVVTKGNLLNQNVDAIVNAANNQLKHGGGIAAAISQQGGPVIQQESDRITVKGALPIGSAVVTSAGKLPFKQIIHAVGPNCTIANQEAHKVQLLTNAYQNSLIAAETHKCSSIAFCSISTDIFGYNIAQATPVAIRAIIDWLRNNPKTQIQEIRLVIYNQHQNANDHVRLYTDTLKNLCPAHWPLAKEIQPEHKKGLQASSWWNKNPMLFRVVIPMTALCVAAAILSFCYYKHKQQQKI